MHLVFLLVFLCAVQGQQIKKHFTRSEMAGLFFYLASTRCRAFILPGCNTAPYKRLQRVLQCQCNYTAHATKQHTGLCSGFSCDCTRSTAHDTRPTQQAIAPPVPRWRAYTRPDALNRYQIPPPRLDAVQGSTAAYYNKVYKRADHASGGGSASTPVNLVRVSPAGSRCLPRPAACSLAPSTRRGSPAAKARRAARNY